MPTGLVGLALVRCKDGSVLFFIRQRNGILAIRLQPLVYLVKVDDPSFAGLGAGDFPVCEFLIDGSKGNVGVLGNLLWRDRAVSVLSLSAELVCSEGSAVTPSCPTLHPEVRQRPVEGH